MRRWSLGTGAHKASYSDWNKQGSLGWSHVPLSHPILKSVPEVSKGTGYRVAKGIGWGTEWAAKEARFREHYSQLPPAHTARHLPPPPGPGSPHGAGATQQGCCCLTTPHTYTGFRWLRPHISPAHYTFLTCACSLVREADRRLSLRFRY